MHPKLINGKVWVPDPVFGGYRQLPENDPKYKEILLWIDSQRFVELLDWVYNRDEPRASGRSLRMPTATGQKPAYHP
jgi:hypothetical protein